MGFRTFGFPPACHPSYGASALTPAGLTPAEHISLSGHTTGRESCPSSGSSLHKRPSRDAAALATAFTIRAWSRQSVRQTFFPLGEYQAGARPGAAPASISAADISACLPESVGRGSLVTEDPREVSPLSR